MRKLLLIILILVCSINVFGRGKYNGLAAKSDVVVTSGTSSTTKAYRTFPGAVITVYLAGTTTLASIYADDSGTIKANPFTAPSDASIQFYADDNRYDIRIAPVGGSPAAFTIGDVGISDASSLFFSVKAYGAVGDGATLDTSAILATIAAAQAAGGRLFFPHGHYLISGSGTEILLITKPLIVDAEDANTTLDIKSTVLSTTYAIRYRPATTADSEGFQIHNLWIRPQSGTPGAGIALDCTNAFIAGFRITNTIISQLGGPAVKLTNPTHRADGIFVGSIDHNQFNGDIIFDYVGDSIHATQNTFTGAGTVDVTLIGGAAMMDFSHNNITITGGVIFHSGKNILISHNEVELQAANDTGANTAMIYLQGDIGAVTDTYIVDNLFQGGGAAPSLNAISYGNQSGAFHTGNSYSLPAGKALIDVTNSSSTIFQGLNFSHGTSVTEISNPFAKPIFSLLFASNTTLTENPNGTWLTNGKFTHLVSTTDSVLAAITTGDQFVSNLATGTAPLSIASTTKVANLNVDLLDGTDWRAPGAIGGTTPGTGAFTTLSATGQITSTLATGTAPFVTSNTTPTNLYARSIVYTAAGTQVLSPHDVLDTATLSGGGTVTVTLSGSAIYTSSSSYTCFPTDLNSGGAVQFVPSSGSQFVFNGTAAHVINYVCRGN